MRPWWLVVVLCTLPAAAALGDPAGLGLHDATAGVPPLALLGEKPEPPAAQPPPTSEGPPLLKGDRPQPPEGLPDGLGPLNSHGLVGCGTMHAPILGLPDRYCAPDGVPDLPLPGEGSEDLLPEPAPAAEPLPLADPEEPAPDAWAAPAVPLQADAGPPEAPEPAWAPAPAATQAPDPAPAPRPAALDAAWAVAAAAALLPAVLLWKALSLLAASRVRKPSPLRQQVLDHVKAEPGIHHSELVRRVGKGNGTVEHHLHRLLREGAVQRLRTRGYTCYFPAQLKDPALLAGRSAVRSPTAQRILRSVADGAGASLTQLGARLGLGPSTVHYHLDRLGRAGLVQALPAGSGRGFGVTPVGAACAGGLPDAAARMRPAPPVAGG